MDLKTRIKHLKVLQEHYSEFVPFLRDTMSFLGFSSTEIQEDIGKYLQYGPHYLMVQAQRGQAKTTVAACYAVWCLIHDPKYRVLIVSAGDRQAGDISTLITRIILHMPCLACLRPDRNRGDRVSAEAFDVYGGLKGVDKSPSVSCVSLKGNFTGARADLLLADDIETAKNSDTQTKREHLLNWSKEFSDICTSGRIIYLGTPQSEASVYNSLPGRGFDVRIWTGRYPTPEQIDNYGRHLAPIIKRRIEANPGLQAGGGMALDQGQPTDPLLQNEEFLQKKERDKGQANFQLQYMLNTKLSDAQRYPLKPINLVVMNLNDRLPLTVERGMSAEYRRSYQIGHTAYEVMAPFDVGRDLVEQYSRLMFVDPAGGGKNGDETAYAIVDHLNGKLFVRDVGGVRGGYDIEQMTALAKIAGKWKPNRIRVEQNMGYGAFIQVWMPILRKHHQCAVEDEWASQQKERRIIETLEPIMARGSLIIDESVLLQDYDSTIHAPAEKRQLYTLMHQLSSITLDKGSLVHDDRLDALAAACRYFVAAMAKDQEKEEEALRAKEMERWLADPLMHNRHQPPRSASRFHSANPKHRRR